MNKNQKIIATVCASLAALWLLSVVFSGWPIVNSPPGPGKIVALGDSLTAGVGATTGNDYVTKLSQLLGREIINRGVSGERSDQALARLEKDVLDEDPDIVIVLLGGNDIIQKKEPAEIIRNIEQIINRSQASGAMVVLVGIEGPALVSTGMKREFKDLAERTGSVYVPDILDGILFDRSKMADQIHPNDAGYAIVAERIYKKMKGEL